MELSGQPAQPRAPSEKVGARFLSRSGPLEKTNILTTAGNRVRISL
jgi:hypothetical protein